jgi:hypothetical protein
MTKEVLLQQIHWDEYGLGNCSLWVPIFQQTIPFVFFPKQHPILIDKMFAAVQDILQLPTTALLPIKELLWEECHFAFTVADYGVDALENESSLQAHLRTFEISDQDAAYQRSTIKAIHISTIEEPLEARYVMIQIDSSSNNYISIIIKNGNVIDFDDDGTCLSSFEQVDNYAQQMRQATLKQYGCD